MLRKCTGRIKIDQTKVYPCFSIPFERIHQIFYIGKHVFLTRGKRIIGSRGYLTQPENFLSAYYNEYAYPHRRHTQPFKYHPKCL